MASKVVGSKPITWSDPNSLTWDCAWGDSTYRDFLKTDFGITSSPRTDSAPLVWNAAKYAVIDLEIPVNVPVDDLTVDWNKKFPVHPTLGLLYVTWDKITKAQLSQVLCPFVAVDEAGMYNGWNPNEYDNLKQKKKKKPVYQEVKEESALDRWKEILENIEKAERGEEQIGIEKDIEILVETPPTRTISLIFIMDGEYSSTLVNEIKTKAQVEVSEMIHEQLKFQPKVKVKKVRIL